jgi:hypothetical protein
MKSLMPPEREALRRCPVTWFRSTIKLNQHPSGRCAVNGADLMIFKKQLRERAGWAWPIATLLNSLCYGDKMVGNS